MVRLASRPLFTDFPQGRILPSLGGLLRSDWQDGAMFAFLPVPVFAATDPALLEEILVDNGVGPFRFYSTAPYITSGVLIARVKFTTILPRNLFGLWK